MYEERPSRLGGSLAAEAPLAGAVLWSTVATSTDAGRVLPDGCMDLLCWDGQLVIAGPDTRAQFAASRRAGERCWGLRFAPGTGPLVFGLPACELRDQRVPLVDVWPQRQVRQLTGQVAEAPDPGQALEQLVADRISGSRQPDPEDQGRWARAATGVLGSGGSVTDCARQAGLSERQLHRRCLRAFGYGPKTLARVLRMQRALQLARGGLPLVEATLTAGYADQAHLAREIRTLAGVPVTRLLGG